MHTILCQLVLAEEARCPVNRYVAQIFLECQSARNFSWKFAAVKDLKALNTVSDQTSQLIAKIIIIILKFCSF